MTYVIPREGESIESLIKRFSKKVANAGIIQEVKKRQAYEKPSDKKRKAFAAAAARYRKKRLKMEEKIKFENENKFRPRRPHGSSRPRPERKPETNQNIVSKETKKVEYRPAQPKTKPISVESIEKLQEKFNNKR